MNTKKADEKKSGRVYKVYAIPSGTVIDHLPAGTALKTIDILGLEKSELLTVGINFDSKKYGKKDIIKVQNRYLSQAETNKLAMLAPNATINIIKDEALIEKKRVEIPPVIEGIVKCSNPMCVTNNENNIITRFYVARKQPLRIRCHHCERYMEPKDIVLL